MEQVILRCAGEDVTEPIAGALVRVKPIAVQMSAYATRGGAATESGLKSAPQLISTSIAGVTGAALEGVASTSMSVRATGMALAVAGCAVEP